jgi:hypothetical protein
VPSFAERLYCRAPYGVGGPRDGPSRAGLTIIPPPGNFPWIELATRESIPVENQQIVAKAIRLVFKSSSQDPISNWNVGICMTLKSQRNPIGEVVMQQTQWPVELGPVRHGYLWGDPRFIENDRQILEDEDGLLIAPYVIEAKDYAAINPTARWAWRAPLGIHSILHLYHGSELKKDIHAGCRNRIIILLKAGSNPRAINSCPFDKMIYGDLEMSVTQYALFTNTLDLWKEALEKLRRSRADVEGLLDEELYLGVPELLNGELEFRSQAENREEFLINIATGRYSERSSWNVRTLGTYLNMCVLDIGCTIRRGCQVFQAKSTPGS